MSSDTQHDTLETSNQNLTPVDSSAAENHRSARKRRKEGKSRSNTQTPKAVSGHISGNEAYASPNRLDGNILPEKHTFVQEDFIAFTFSDGEKEEDEAAEERNSTREWDRGKGKGRDNDSLGRKRKLDEIDLNDGYASKKQRVDAASRRAPWATDVDWEHCNNVATLLHHEVEAFVKYISPTPIEDEIRSLTVQLISKAVAQAFPDARVLPFGSYETKLYLPLGDIDLVIESQSMAYSNKTAVLQALANVVKRAGITDKVSIIAKAKVPIIKFVTRHGRFSVDMSINQTNGVAAGEMVKNFIAELPALRSLVLIVKSFLNQRSMNEVFTGGLGSYSIVCLAISFLQQHPKIRRGEMDPSKNLGVLVMEFFELYGCYFNYQEVGICVRDGGSYFNKAQRGWVEYRAPGLLSIEDPGDPSNDISRGSFGIAKVRTTLAGAFSIMASKAYNHANMISARRDRRYVQLQSRADPEALSILASVMGVTQETINRRQLVQEVYDKHVLHRVLGVEPGVVFSSRPSGKRPSDKDSKKAADSVNSAWEEADVGLNSDHRYDAELEEEESRYDIDSRQPPRKRRRTNTRLDEHVYISDDDEDEGVDLVAVDSAPLVVHTVGNSDSGSAVVLNDSEQEDAYDIGDSDDDAKQGKREKVQRTRSYWLSKGVGV